MLHFIETFIKSTREKDLEECIGETIFKFNSKIVLEVRPRYRDILMSYKEPSRRHHHLHQHRQSNHSGISNPGAVHCYSNSVLQSLFHHVDLLKDLKNLFNVSHSSPFIKEFIKVGESLCNNNNNSNNTIDISTLRDIIFSLPRFKEFKSSDQQDAQEYLILLFEVLEEEIATIIGRENIESEKNPLFHYYAFQVSYSYQCDNCQSTSTNRKTFKILPLVNLESEETSTITDLVNQYFHEETGISWQCTENCFSSTSTRCSTTLLRCPPNPIIYVVHPTLYTTQKKSQPLQLTSTLSIGNSKLHLTGIIRHTGHSPTSGHYIAYLKLDNKWEYFNDSVHRQVSLSLSIIIAIIIKNNNFRWMMEKRSF